MAVAFDAQAGANTGASAAGVLSWSHTTSGADRALVVAFATSSGFNTLPTPTYNSVSLTQLGTGIDEGSFEHHTFRLVAPATGANTVEIDWAGNENVAAVSNSFTGVDQTTPEGTVVEQEHGYTNSPSIDVTSETDGMVVDFVSPNETGWDSSEWTAGSGQTKRQWEYADTGNSATRIAIGGSTEAGAATVTMSWSRSGSGTTNPNQSGVPLKPAGAAAAGALFSGLTGVGI